ncbi:23S rRNA pseudouridine(1911/1915/1917) synthase RluD [Leucothrix pacifica]|uniref:Pseudouridine synthase n=1 Tax=Leucothrix pacifica TaxID=1247513 RepID=A0A317CGJ8_9GAMM|nr:23S rRNA pseudouridine(1911/1915/1917) synthase RluD [Leucothrix pacifica]PWQ97695.1 23S rRNA pseudouridine(1911/1915/1917) synthase RluD [Leucothrix pacifica]
MSDVEIIELIVPESSFNQRVDKVLADLCPDYSRSQLQKWLKAGDITIDGRVMVAKEKVRGGEAIVIRAMPIQRSDFQPENIPLDIRYEDDYLLILNKPAGLVVHPAAGNWSGTLMNALLAHNDHQNELPRAGIVHRLDKDTTGLMMVAKDLKAHHALVEALQEREISREYQALVCGELISGGTIEGNIGRHARDRKKMTVLEEGGKHAITHYRIEERMDKHTLLRVHLETGRTHQIRVHFSWKHHPLVGDKTYGGRLRIPSGLGEAKCNALRQFPRQALHAARLSLDHPITGEPLSVEAEMPDDMKELLAVLMGESGDE